MEIYSFKRSGTKCRGVLLANSHNYVVLSKAKDLKGKTATIVISNKVRNLEGVIFNIQTNFFINFMYNHEPKDYKCLFCRLNGGIVDENVISKQNDIVYQDEFLTAFIGTHWWLHNPGSVIIVPNKHVENLYDLDDETGAKIFALSKKVAIAMKHEYKCDGVSTRQHNEPAGNQDVSHFHYHVIPRYTGDDLYINHKTKKFIEPEERKIWADKLKGKIV